MSLILPFTYEPSDRVALSGSTNYTVPSGKYAFGQVFSLVGSNDFDVLSVTETTYSDMPALQIDSEYYATDLQFTFRQRTTDPSNNVTRNITFPLPSPVDAIAMTTRHRRASGPDGQTILIRGVNGTLDTTLVTFVASATNATNSASFTNPVRVTDFRSTYFNEEANVFFGVFEIAVPRPRKGGRWYRSGTVFSTAFGSFSAEFFLYNRMS
jgi:hypothetical protein